MAILKLKKDNEEIRIPFEGEPTVAEVLRGAGYVVEAPCGGTGRCGRCAVRVQGAVSDPDGEERAHGTRLACRSVLLGDATVELYDTDNAYRIETGSPLTVSGSMDGYGIAVDVGTTTVALRLYSGDGVCVGQSASLNGQRAFSADVVGRIHAALNGRGDEMRTAVLDCIRSLLTDACHQAGISVSRIHSAVMTGNTAMLYLLTGRSVVSLSRAPFKCDHRFDEWTRLLGIPTYLPRVMNAYVGADVTCAVVASGMCSSHRTTLLCDIGTNGELALWRDGRLYVTSVAAGPAFEGAQISCGCGSTVGGIDRVWNENGRIAFHTIGDAPESGLCGSGLLDAVAVLLQTGMIDKGGYSDEPLRIGALTLTADDVQAFVAAKAAVRAGIEVLLSRTGVRAEDIETVYIAGGFGAHLDMRSAALVGLIPSSFVGKAVSIGNGALAGASQMLLSNETVALSRRVAADAVHLPLGGEDDFSREFIRNMSF